MLPSIQRFLYGVVSIRCFFAAVFTFSSLLVCRSLAEVIACWLVYSGFSFSVPSSGFFRLFGRPSTPSPRYWSSSPTFGTHVHHQSCSASSRRGSTQRSAATRARCFPTSRVLVGRGTGNPRTNQQLTSRHVRARRLPTLPQSRFSLRQYRFVAGEVRPMLKCLSRS